MAKTVIAAFNEFLTDTVNLDPEDTKKAKSSREWLVNQIDAFPEDDDFPLIYAEKNIFYGSFSRSTKKRPLDDIDIMICIKAEGCTYMEYDDRIEINVPNTATRFLDYINQNTDVLNSKRIINAFVSKLADIPQYKKADIKRNFEAATLDLQTYDWTFDIVPCFFTSEDAFKRTYYIIPDGYGNWKKTDPRLDNSRLKEVNTAHKGNILNVIRSMKYWNNRPTMPTMGSYLLENMLLDYYAEKTTIASAYVDIELVSALYDIHKRVKTIINDPKNIQGNLNNLTSDEKTKISDRAYADYSKAYDARDYEKKGDHSNSIKLWREIFGDKFPKYE